MVVKSFPPADISFGTLLHLHRDVLLDRLRSSNMHDMQLQTAPVSQSIRTFTCSILPFMCACKPPGFPVTFHILPGASVGPHPYCWVRVQCYVWGNLWQNAQRFYIKKKQTENAAAQLPSWWDKLQFAHLGVLSTVGCVLVAIPVVDCCCGGFLGPFQAPRPPSAPSSWWSSASLSSTIDLLGVVRVVARLVRCHAHCRSRHGSPSFVVCLRWFSAVLLLHAGDQGLYFGHIRVHGRVVSGRRVAASASRAGFGMCGGDAKRRCEAL